MGDFLFLPSPARHEGLCVGLINCAFFLFSCASSCSERDAPDDSTPSGGEFLSLGGGKGRIGEEEAVEE